MENCANGANGPVLSVKEVEALRARVIQLEAEKTSAMASVGGLVVEREQLRGVNAQMEHAFDELHTRYEALTKEQMKWQEAQAAAFVEREKVSADMAARDDELMRLESQVAELKKQRIADAKHLEALKDGLEDMVSKQIAAQQSKWKRQVDDALQAFQEEKLELEVFNDVLKVKANARSLEAQARGDQVAILEAENAQLLIALELLAQKLEEATGVTKVGAVSRRKGSSSTAKLQSGSFKPVSESVL